MLGIVIHFLYFSQPSVSKICSFINSCTHPSLFWVFEKLSQHLPFRCVHIFFQKLVMISEFFQIKVGNYLFSQTCFQLDKFLFFIYFLFFLLFSFLTHSLFLFLFFFFLFEVIYHLFISVRNFWRYGSQLFRHHFCDLPFSCIFRSPCGQP